MPTNQPRIRVRKERHRMYRLVISLGLVAVGGIVLALALAALAAGQDAWPTVGTGALATGMGVLALRAQLR